MSDPDAFTAMMDDFHLQWASGDALAAVRAISFAGKYGMPAPEWASRVLFDALVAYTNGTAATLDEALGLHRAAPRPTLHAKMYKVRLDAPHPNRIAELVAAVDRERAAGHSLTKASERVGAAMGMGMTDKTVRKWYHKGKGTGTP